MGSSQRTLCYFQITLRFVKAFNSLFSSSLLEVLKSPLRFWCGGVLQITDLFPDSSQFTVTVMVSPYKKMLAVLDAAVAGKNLRTSVYWVSMFVC